MSEEGKASAASAARRRWTRRRICVAVVTVLSLVVVAVVSVGFGAHYGFNYGISNQNSYLLGGLVKQHPELYTTDWLVAKTTNYHWAFAWVAWPLFALGRGGWPFAIANVVANAAAAALVFALVRSIVRPRLEALATWLIVMGVSFATQTNSVAVSYLVGEIFQPSTLGALGLLAAIVLFLRGRWLASGLCLAAGGFMHGNYLLLGLLVLPLAHAFLGTEGIVRRGLLQFLPAVPVLLLMAPTIGGAALDPNGAAAREILFNIRGPHHYVPRSFETGFFALAGWQALGLGAGARLLRGATPGGTHPPDPQPGRRRLAAFAAAIVIVLWAGTALTTAWTSASIQQLFPWRLSPLSDVLFQTLAAAALVRVVARPMPAGLDGPRKVALAVGGIGLAMLLMFCGNRIDKAKPEAATAVLLGMVKPAIAVAVVAVVVALVLQLGGTRLRATSAMAERAARGWRRWGAVLAVAVAAWLAWKPAAIRLDRPGLEKRSSLLRPGNAAERDLYAWIGENTPVTATFLVNPEMENFRLHSRRGIVVDWKTPPIVPTEVLDWYQRLVDVAGIRVGRRSDLGKGYKDLDAKRVAALREKYGFDYVVVQRRSKLALSGALPVVYDGGYAVLDAREGAAPVEPARPATPKATAEPEEAPPVDDPER